MTSDRRVALRDTDAEAYQVLAALRIAALHYGAGSANGTRSAGAQPGRQDLEQWLTTSEAAEMQGVTDRAIRKWIATGRLPAKRHAGRWLISRNDLNIQALAA